MQTRSLNVFAYFPFLFVPKIPKSKFFRAFTKHAFFVRENFGTQFHLSGNFALFLKDQNEISFFASISLTSFPEKLPLDYLKNAQEARKSLNVCGRYCNVTLYVLWRLQLVKGKRLGFNFPISFLIIGRHYWRGSKIQAFAVGHRLFLWGGLLQNLHNPLPTPGTNPWEFFGASDLQLLQLFCIA